MLCVSVMGFFLMKVRLYKVRGVLQKVTNKV